MFYGIRSTPFNHKSQCGTVSPSNRALLKDLALAEIPRKTDSVFETESVLGLHR